jgi:hypothetical protein
MTLEHTGLAGLIHQIRHATSGVIADHPENFRSAAHTAKPRPGPKRLLPITFRSLPVPRVRNKFKPLSEHPGRTGAAPATSTVVPGPICWPSGRPAGRLVPCNHPVCDRMTRVFERAPERRSIPPTRALDTCQIKRFEAFSGSSAMGLIRASSEVSIDL